MTKSSGGEPGLVRGETPARAWSTNPRQKNVIQANFMKRVVYYETLLNINLVFPDASRASVVLHFGRDMVWLQRKSRLEKYGDGVNSAWVFRN
jgi:hypothetical protein